MAVTSARDNLECSRSSKKMSSTTQHITADTTLARFQDKTARVGIIGMGYVGLPLALLFSDAGFRVTGFDIDERKVTTLNGGGSYIVRILPAEIQAAQKHGFSATSDYAGLREMDAIIICV